MDDMLVKSEEAITHERDLEETLVPSDGTK